MTLGFILGTALAATQVAEQPAAPTPKLEYAFSARVELAPPVELGTVDGGRRRYIPITGGSISGPKLSGTVLAGGGDWQTILPNGLTLIDTHYVLKVGDGTVIEIENPGVRTASAEIVERLAKGEDVDPSLYYFRTTPRFQVSGDKYAWLRRYAFVARGVRKPDHVVVDFYIVQ